MNVFSAHVCTEESNRTEFSLEKNDLGLEPNQFLQIALFIQTKLPAFTSKGKYYLTKAMTGLDHTLEYDPKSNHTFILFEGDKRAYIGRGAKKKVNKAILFDKKRPFIVARGEQSSPMSRELRITKALQGAPGIMRTRAYTTRKWRGKHYTAIYSDLYSPGSLYTLLEKKMKFSTIEKAKIIANILKGLKSLHTRRIVHRDLHPKNYLLHITAQKNGKRDIDAVIADLGHAMYTCCANSVLVQGISKYCAPEGLFRNRMRGKDYFATDIYAVGSVFYRLFYEKIPAWQDKSYVKNTKYSVRKNHRLLLHKLLNATLKRRTYLAAKKSKKRLTTKENLEYLILRMLDANPAKRGSASSLCSDAQKILRKACKKQNRITTKEQDYQDLNEIKNNKINRIDRIRTRAKI